MKFDKTQLNKGIRIEMEHAGSFSAYCGLRTNREQKEMAQLIVEDHLNEDPKYYTKLRKAGL